MKSDMRDYHIIKIKYNIFFDKLKYYAIYSQNLTKLAILSSQFEGSNDNFEFFLLENQYFILDIALNCEWKTSDFYKSTN